MNVQAWNQQHNNNNKTYENWPMVGGTQIFDGNINVQIDKKDTDRVNNRLQCDDFIGARSQSLLQRYHQPKHMVKLICRNQCKQENNCERIESRYTYCF